MALIVTPRTLSRQAEFYHQLSSMTSAGVPLLQALEQIHRSPPAGVFRAPIQAVLVHLKQGYTLTESLSTVKGWLPDFDLALISAGEQSGRLDACFRLLGNYYADRATLARSVIADLAYPAFVVHLAILIFPPQLITDMVFKGAVMPFVMNKVSTLAPLYVIAFLLIYASQGQRPEYWRDLIERFVDLIPVLGKARRSLALARLSAALESLIGAGVGVINGWEISAAASGSPALRRAVYAWRPRLEAGATPAEMLQLTRRFPELFSNLYNTGEISGTLEDTLRRLHRLYQEEASRKLKAVGEWTPRIVYMLILLRIAQQVLGFWTGYYEGMFKSIGM